MPSFSRQIPALSRHKFQFSMGDWSGNDSDEGFLSDILSENDSLYNGWSDQSTLVFPYDSDSDNSLHGTSSDSSHGTVAEFLADHTCPECEIVPELETAHSMSNMWLLQHVALFVINGKIQWDCQDRDLVKKFGHSDWVWLHQRLYSISVLSVELWFISRKLVQSTQALSTVGQIDSKWEGRGHSVYWNEIVVCMY